MQVETSKLQHEVTFHDAADVVIVGFGGAGACAAIAAAEDGADVLIVERTTGGGGSTALSGGFLYLGGGTVAQKANGFEDTPDNMARYIEAVQPKAAHDKVHAYCEGSVAHHDWLVGLGVPFNEKYYSGKHFHPDDEATLVWTGSEACWPFNESSNPVPRGHKPGGGYVGYILFDCLRRRVKELGIRIINDAAVNALVTDDSGTVVGVQYRKEGSNLAIGARQAVILATGGCEWDRELAVENGAKSGRAGVQPLGAPTADGAGIKLGESVGAVVKSLDQCIVTSPFYPPESLIKCILVNKDGKRFVAEDVYHSRSTDAIMEQPDGKAYLICDSINFGRPELGKIRSEQSHELIDAWGSVEEMEADLGIPTGNLVKTIEDYNRYAHAGHDEELRKMAKWLEPIVEPPFAAIDCSVGAAYFCSLSLGGLETNIDGQVVKPDGGVVSGLFAVGQLAPTIAVEGPGYASGFLIGSGTFFGRKAGTVATAMPKRVIDSIACLAS